MTLSCTSPHPNCRPSHRTDALTVRCANVLDGRPCDGLGRPRRTRTIHWCVVVSAETVTRPRSYQETRRQSRSDPHQITAATHPSTLTVYPPPGCQNLQVDQVHPASALTCAAGVSGFGLPDHRIGQPDPESPARPRNATQRTFAGVLDRLLALTAAIWHNEHTSQSVLRSFTAYDH